MRELILLLFLIALYKPGEAQETCVTPRLTSGATARVMMDDGLGLVLRDGVGRAGTNIITTVPEGAIFTVLNGSACVDNAVWWQVRLTDGREGFLPEGGTTRYYVEPYQVGVHLFEEDAANNQLSHLFVDARGTVQAQPALPLIPRTGTAVDLWQSTEITFTTQVLQERRANCPDVLPLEIALDIHSVFFTDNQHEFYASPDGQKILVFRHYHVAIPDCDNQGSENYGTTYLSLLDENGEQEIFPYSQHSDPPPSTFCQPPNVAFREQRTFIDEVAWSPDGTYAALSVRYLRDGQNFPCAFYHIFLVNTETLEVSYVDVGRRLIWTDDGRRLQYVRVERSDPNDSGIERMFSILPDGTDKVEIFLPGDVTLLPGAMDIQHSTLPWQASGKQLLVCAGRDYTCEAVRTLFPQTASLTPVLAAPLQMGIDLASVHYVAGGTKLLWLSTDGKVLLQNFEGEVRELEIGQPVIEVRCLPSGIGAVLQTPENRYFYYDAGLNTVKETGV